jgi:hypothetical protein
MEGGTGGRPGEAAAASPADEDDRERRRRPRWPMDGESWKAWRRRERVSVAAERASEADLGENLGAVCTNRVWSRTKIKREILVGWAILALRFSVSRVSAHGWPHVGRKYTCRPIVGHPCRKYRPTIRRNEYRPTNGRCSISLPTNCSLVLFPTNSPSSIVTFTDQRQ